MATAEGDKKADAVVVIPPDMMDFTEMLSKFTRLLALLLVVWLAGVYGVSFAWVILVSFVVVLYMKQRRERQRRKLVARCVSNDAQKIIADTLKEDLPAWVNFPDVERAEWLNKILRQFWPYLEKLATATLRETVEPELRRKAPSSLGGIRFETIRLGDIPPRITGIKAHVDKVKRSEIILDVDILYAGDSKITIAFKAAGVKTLKVGVEDIQIKGNVRIILHPLLPEMPLIGGITMYFINRPQLDFDLTNLTNVLDIPGLSTLLRNLIDDEIARYIVLPNKVAMSLSDKVSQGELKNRLPDGLLRIKMIEGRYLEAKDLSILGKNDTSDPYATVVVGAEKFTTSIKKRTLNPIWNETFETLVDECNRQTIQISVFDHDNNSKDDELGEKRISLDRLLEESYQDSWVQLDKAKTGRIHLQMTWLTFTDDSQIVKSAPATTPSKKNTLTRAVLVVHVDSASNLPRVLIVGRSSQKTCKMTETVNPVWQQSLRFLVQDPEYQDVKFQVWDHKKDRLLGSFSVKISRLLDAGGMEITEAFALDDCSHEAKLTAKLTLLGVLEPPFDATPEGGNERIGPIGKENAKAGETRTTGCEDENHNKSSLDMTDEDPFLDASQDVSSSSLNQNSSVDKSEGEGSGKSKFGLLLRRARALNSSSAMEGDFKLTTPQGEISIALVYQEKTKRLVIGVLQARELIDCTNEDEDRNNINAYVRIYLLPDRSRITRLTTDVVKQTNNPIFNETLWYMVESLEECRKKKLDLMVKTETPLIKKAKGARHGLGRTIIDLAEEELDNNEPKWKTLYRSEDS
eukprot:gene12225-13485_t